jgi:hypothetical protein
MVWDDPKADDARPLAPLKKRLYITPKLPQGLDG